MKTHLKKAVAVLSIAGALVGGTTAYAASTGTSTTTTPSTPTATAPDTGTTATTPSTTPTPVDHRAELRHARQGRLPRDVGRLRAKRPLCARGPLPRSSTPSAKVLSMRRCSALAVLGVLFLAVGASGAEGATGLVSIGAGLKGPSGLHAICARRPLRQRGGRLRARWPLCEGACMRLLSKLVALVALALALGASGADGATPLVSIGAGLEGPSGLRATVYATGLEHVSAFAFDAKGRLWVTTSAATDHASDGVYLVRAAGATPVKVIAGLQGPLGLVWRSGTLYVASIGRVDAYRGFTGHALRLAHDDPDRAERPRLEPGPRARAERPADHVDRVCLRPLHDDVALLGVDHLVRPGRHGVQTYAARVRAAFGLAFYPGTSTLFASMNQRDDLGAKTPGDALAIVRAGEDWRFPACYEQGGSACSGVPADGRDARQARGGRWRRVSRRARSARRSEPPRSSRSGSSARCSRSGSRRTASGYTGGTPTTVLTGFRSPLPLIMTASRALLVGDWATGTIYRIAASA